MAKKSVLLFKGVLAKKLVIAILFFSSGVTLIGTAIQLYMDYRTDLSRIHQSLRQIKESYLDSLAHSLWNLDDTQIHLQLEGILHLPDLEYVAVRYRGLIIASVGQRKSFRTVSREFQVAHTDFNETFALGTLSVVIGLDQVYQRLLDKFFLILGTQGIKTFLVSAFIFLIFQYLVTQHLVSISDYAQRLDVHHLDIPLTLPVSSAGTTPTELDHVVTAINDMRISLKDDIAKRQQAEEQIKNHAVLLEQAVVEKTREMQLMADRMVRQEKLAVIGQLSAGIAHEIRNPLGAIKQAAFFLNDVIDPEKPRVKRFLQVIEEQANTANQVITDLLEMTHTKLPDWEKIHLAALIKDAYRQCLLKHLIHLDLALEPETLEIYGDYGQLRQVFINLITNADQAYTQAGTITIKAKILNDQKKCVIQILDQGRGIAPHHLEQVFDPLFTTKSKGTGLGLSLCKQIIELHRGKISVESREKGEDGVGGTTIHIALLSSFPDELMLNQKK